MFDVTAPIADLTGRERSQADLARPDDRNLRYAGYSAEAVQALFLHADDLIGPRVPARIKERLAVAHKIGAYGWFAWEFYTVSMFWSLTTVEMALKTKFVEVTPGPYKLVKKTKAETKGLAFSELQRQLRRGWRIDGLPEFDGSLNALLVWARDAKMLPADTPLVLQELRNRFVSRMDYEFIKDALEAGRLTTSDPTSEERQALWDAMTSDERKKYEATPLDVIVEELPDLRNQHAHPHEANWMVPPRSAVMAYQQAVEIVTRLWPA